MHKKELTIFLGKSNRYYDKNIDIINKYKYCFSTIFDSSILGKNFSLYSINKLLQNIDSHYFLFLDDYTQLNPKHFQEIIFQLQESEEDYYYFHELYLDRDKWIPSPKITSQSKFGEFCKHINGLNQVIIRKNFITTYFLAHNNLEENIFKDKHILFYLYKKFPKTTNSNILTLKFNQSEHNFQHENEIEKIFSDFSQILSFSDDEFIEEICKTLIELLSILILTKTSPLERLDIFITIKKYMLLLWPKQITHIEIFNQKISFSTFSEVNAIDFIKLAKII